MILFEAIHFNYKIVKYNDFILQDFHHITIIRMHKMLFINQSLIVT